MKKRNKALLAASIASMVAMAGTAVMQNNAMAVGDSVHCYGVNKCKGTGECGGTGHSCAGKNACKGQGYLSLSEDTCLKIEGGRLTADEE